MRQLIERALEAGRKIQNSQTGFIHYCRTAQDGDLPVAIPILENILFALTLFRSRTAENITEAKSLVERLLFFQNTEEGNFPIYLHEYPQCHDWYLGFSLLIPFYWILSEFQTVLGHELRKKLEKSLSFLLTYCEKRYSEIILPVPVALRFAVAAKALGTFWQDSLLAEKGERHLRSETLLSDSSYWGCPAQIGHVLASLRLVYRSLKGTPWEAFWEFLGHSWHGPTCSFIGPSHKEYQEHFEPQITLYDLYLGSIHNTYSRRSLESSPIHLEAALIYPFTETLSNGHSGSYALSLIEREEGWNKAADGSFHPLRLIWGTPQRLHSFVCQGGNIRKSTYKRQGEHVELLFELDEEVPEEDREKNREIAFYLDVSEAHKILVEGILATTFKIGEELIIRSHPINISLKFTLEEGMGHFMGHIMKGNRPAQVGAKGKNKYSAFDWQIFLRTLHRSGICRIKAEMRLC